MDGLLALGELVAGVVGWYSVKSAAAPVWCAALLHVGIQLGDLVWSVGVGVPWGCPPASSFALNQSTTRPLDAWGTTTITHCNTNIPRRRKKKWPWNAGSYVAITIRRTRCPNCSSRTSTPFSTVRCPVIAMPRRDSAQI